MNLNSINVEYLKTAINDCLNKINRSSSKELASSIMASSLWINDCKKNIKNGLEEFTKIYEQLESKLNDYKYTLIPKIESYQQYSSNNENLTKEIIELKKQLYYDVTEEYEDWENVGTFDEPINKVVKKSRTVTKINNDVQNKINAKENEIQNNKMAMEEIERNIINFV